jgi:hypothetical protein
MRLIHGRGGCPDALQQAFTVALASPAARVTSVQLPQVQPSADQAFKVPWRVNRLVTELLVTALRRHWQDRSPQGLPRDATGLEGLQVNGEPSTNQSLSHCANQVANLLLTIANPRLVRTDLRTCDFSGNRPGNQYRQRVSVSRGCIAACEAGKWIVYFSVASEVFLG